jgi:hypothetical protein
MNDVSMSAAEIMRQRKEAEPHARALARSMESSFTLECVPCGHEETETGLSEWAALMSFALDGWRVVQNEAHCADCVESENKDQPQ